ncbi:hypothetical protein MMC14_000842 [Varicellaria rhodocarpa]|nr:hypothetical protein [Varicellaria rhodocarpa]
MSGSVLPAQPIQASRSQSIFNQVVQTCGCSNNPDPLVCLRNLPYEAFLNAVIDFPSVISYSSLNLHYLPRPDTSSTFFSSSPEIAIMAGKYARVPILIGSNEHDGTLFSLLAENLTSTTDLE